MPLEALHDFRSVHVFPKTQDSTEDDDRTHLLNRRLVFGQSIEEDTRERAIDVVHLVSLLCCLPNVRGYGGHRRPR